MIDLCTDTASVRGLATMREFVKAPQIEASLSPRNLRGTVGGMEEACAFSRISLTFALSIGLFVHLLHLSTGLGPDLMNAV